MRTLFYIIFIFLGLINPSLASVGEAPGLKPSYNVTSPSNSSAGQATKSLGFNENKKSAESARSLRAVELHNQALDYLTKNKPDVAKALLQKNFYENLFFPSYYKLKDLSHKPSLIPFLSQIAILLWAVFSLILLFIFWKRFLAANQKRANHIKQSLAYFLFWSGFTLILYATILSLPKRLSNLNSLELFNAPSEQSLSIGRLEAGSDILVLKSKGAWVQIQTPNKQKSWVLKQDFLETWSAWN